ncbi:MAG: AAA family ATPase [Deltaproteobacteria bacterium]|nr:AAA family ATPase [Deltaproteobacteria bacterium]
MKEKSPLPPLLTHQSSLYDFIESKSPVVDKTALICDLMNKNIGPYFLARPRRFGKTLLLDTINAIANGDKELFGDMAIVKDNLKYDWCQFPVIRIDLSDVDSEPEYFQTTLTNNLKRIADDLEVNVPDSTPADVFSELVRRVSSNGQPYSPYSASNNIKPKINVPRNVVLLIDEYDFPLMENIGDPIRTEAIRKALRKFYASVKKNMTCFRFVLITGVTKFDQLSPLSGMNNLKDITLEPDYSTICGFTLKEITSTFCEYIPLSLKNMKIKGIMKDGDTEADLLNEIEKWYDGYTWDGNTKVLNPYSVMSCLANSKFENFWYNSGTSMFIHQLGLGRDAYFRLFLNDLSMSSNPTEPVMIPSPNISSTHNLAKENHILFQAGYLTIDRIIVKDGEEKYFLKIPNNEIKNAIVNQFLSKLSIPIGSSDPENYINEQYKEFFDSFCSLDIMKAENLFTSFITSIPYYYELNEEWVFCVLLYFCLNIGKHRPVGESVMIKGRTDLVVRTPSNDWIIIEVKHEKPHTPQKYSGGGCEEKSDKPVRLLDSNAITNPNHGTSPFSEILSHIPPPGVPSGEIVPMRLTQQGQISLEKNISKAFNQIVARRYTSPYLGSHGNIYAAAVAIYDSSFVRIRFRRVIWKNLENQEIEYVSSSD